MTKYRKKPVVVEAMQIKWGSRFSDVLNFVGKNSDEVLSRNEDGTVNIKTLEGTMKADIDDYIIKGIQGEFYPCKPDIFAKTYERVE